MYKILKDEKGNLIDVVLRTADNACIPFDPANMDFVEYQKWLSEGNEPLPPDEPTLS